MTRKVLWRDSLTSQGMPADTRTCRRQGKYSFQKLWRRYGLKVLTLIPNDTDFGYLAFRNINKNLSVALSHQVCQRSRRKWIQISFLLFPLFFYISKNYSVTNWKSFALIIFVDFREYSHAKSSSSKSVIFFPCLLFWYFFFFPVTYFSWILNSIPKEWQGCVLIYQHLVWKTKVVLICI